MPDPIYPFNICPPLPVTGGRLPGSGSTPYPSRHGAVTRPLPLRTTEQKAPCRGPPTATPHPPRSQSQSSLILAIPQSPSLLATAPLWCKKREGITLLRSYTSVKSIVYKHIPLILQRLYWLLCSHFEVYQPKHCSVVANWILKLSLRDALSWVIE